MPCLFPPRIRTRTETPSDSTGPASRFPLASQGCVGKAVAPGHLSVMPRFVPKRPSSRETQYSVANRAVAGAQHLSEALLRQQLSYFGRIARMPDGAAIRQVVFEPRTLQLKSVGPRRRGRPRISWAGAVRQHAVMAAGGEQQLQDACAHEDTPQARRVWAATVRLYLSARASQGCV